MIEMASKPEIPGKPNKDAHISLKLGIIPFTTIKI
jgi:hypothetical protein